MTLLHDLYHKIRKASYGIKRVILSIPGFMSDDFLEQVSKVMVVSLARAVSSKVPAYKEFLAERKMEGIRIESFADFLKLPIMDKKNYFLKYDLERTLFKKSITESYGWEQSSNYEISSGYTLWPRFPEEEQKCVTNLEFLLRYLFGCKGQNTLIVICFVLGMWSAGERITRFSKQISKRGKIKLTVAAPGASRKNAVELIQKVGHFYDQIILVGNPYFLRRVIDYGEKEGMDWKRANIRLLSSAEGFSEEWRDFMTEKLGSPGEAAKLINKRIVSVFGITETGGTFATETPLANLVRRLSWKDAKLRKALFGQEESLPYLFQYPPTEYFLESQNDELIISTLSAQPLVRFNTHDLGSPVGFKQVMTQLQKAGYDLDSLLKDEGYSRKDILPLPFVYVFGRNKNCLKIQGVTFAAEDFQAYVSQGELIKTNTGNFKVQVAEAETGGERLHLTIELLDGIKPTAELKEKYRDIFLESLPVKGFIKYCDGNLKEIEPIIELVSKGQEPFCSSEQAKYRYIKQ